MNEWAKVVSHPLGLAGFALFLVFLIVGMATGSKERRVLTGIFLVAAFLCLGGGLVFYYIQSGPPAGSPRVPQSPESPSHQENGPVQQRTNGPASPAIQGVQGDVTVNVQQGRDNAPHSSRSRQ